MSNFLKIFPIVEAQSADAVAQPTFGVIQGGSGNSITSTILLNSDKTSVNIGSQFKVKVRISTNNISISEYKIVVNFDPALLTVIDQDPNTLGTQIKSLDTIFKVQDVSKDNNVSSQGVILLDAKVTSNNAFAIQDRDVAEITFQAQSAGTTNIKIAQGADGSQLIRLQGNGLSYTTSEINVQIGANLLTSSSSSSQSTIISSSSPLGSSSISTVQYPIASTVLPKTALSSDLIVGINILIGIILLIAGISLRSGKNKNKIDKT